MRKEIKVRHIEPKEEINPSKTQEKEEKVVSYDTDTKKLSLMILSVVLVAFILGWFMRDHGLQDWIDNIKELRKDNVVSQRIINKETKAIQLREQEIQKTKEKVQKDYNITVN